jgi:DNA-binding NtrC family response regulator
MTVGEQSRAAQARLLIVEDDNVLRDALADLFSENYSCAVVGTAEEAINLFGSQPFAVIITDIMMPGMSGTDLVGFIRKYQPGAAVIIITGGSDQASADKLRARGVFRYIRKPFSLQEIEEAVYQASGRRASDER